MTIAVSIGCYHFPHFAQLCLRRVRRIFGENTPILLSDDLSDNSPRMRALAEVEGCSYMVGKTRRSHFSGDMQAIVNAISLAEQTERDIALKISQRFIPVLPSFREELEEGFNDEKNMILVPGQIPTNQITRVKARFYSRFGILTDVVAIRRGALTAQELIEAYRERTSKGKKSDSMVETTIGWLMAERFNGRVKVVDAWATHVPMQPKMFLRKSQSSPAEYGQIAAMEKVEGAWDVREWGQIERIKYRPLATQV